MATKVELTEKMQGKIEELLKRWNNLADVREDAMFDIHDYADSMEDAVDLLKEVVGYENEED